MTDSGLVISHQDNVWLALVPGGIALQQVRNLSAKVLVPYGQRSRGLLGDNDGDPSNDLKSAEGVAVPDGNVSAIHSWFADSWRITQAESKFSYDEGKNTNSYTDRTFPKNVVKISDFTASEISAANSKCLKSGVLEGPLTEACVLDLLVTANGDFAIQAASNKAVVSPGEVSFDAQGGYVQNFDGAIPYSLLPS